MEIKTVSIIGLRAIGILFVNHMSKRMPIGNLRIIVDIDKAEVIYIHSYIAR
jgi:2-dehydropantoate 2-reductase